MEIQKGPVAKSYMTKGLLIYGKIFAHFLINDEALPHIWLCNRSHLNFPYIWEENFVFFFNSAYSLSLSWQHSVRQLSRTTAGRSRRGRWRTCSASSAGLSPGRRRSSASSGPGQNQRYLGSIPASVGTVESEGRQMKQCWIQYKKPPLPPKKSEVQRLNYPWTRRPRFFCCRWHWLPPPPPPSPTNS